MDIFTTQLTRVVPVPIKPASLKVKALLKDAANSKLTQDPDHLENHEYYFTADADEYHSSEKKPEQKTKKKLVQPNADDQPANEKNDNISNQDERVEPKNAKIKHLDLYA
jgi:hypothetical protein